MLKYERQFDGEPITWEERTAEIKQGDTVVFKQENIRVPSTWSQLATNIAASKYFYGKLDTPERETGIDQLVARVADTIAEWGMRDGYFDDKQDFHADLTWLLLHQYCAFNSPVWFNVGLYQKYGATADPGNWYWDKKTNRIKEAQNPLEYSQVSACFIQGVEDNMDSIMNLARSDAMLFKFGSGSGTNLSPLRASCEGLTGGGHSSGPLSFMRIYDQVAETVTSGGRVRRAALLHCLDIDHPDIDKFISCKAEEESHARMLIDRGVTPERAAKSVMYQNMNISVQVSDAFMQAVENDEDWVTKWVTTGQDGPVFKARDLWKKIAESTWLCGDPGVQFSDTINSYNTIPHVGRITSSNPCCFTGDTEILTNEGKLTFKQLVKKWANNVKVFSYDLDTNLPVLRKIKRIWRSGYTHNLVKITTDKGIIVTCTPEHLFYTRQGDTLEAKYLRPGHRLKKLSIKENPHRRGVLMLNHKCTKQHPNGCQYLHRFVYEQTTGTSVSKNYHVHHIDENLENYRFSNLQLKAKFLHLSDHSKAEHNPRYINVEPEALVEFYETIEDLHGYVSAGLWNKYIKKWKLNRILPAANCKRIQGRSWSDFCVWVDENRDLTNDIVEDVEFIHLEKKVPVYDMEVEGTHNFVVSSPGNRHGLVVHNSEYLAPNDSACNLASINLLKFLKDGKFDYETFQKVVRLLIIAQDILIDRASYPLKDIARNSHRCRQLGLGYTNLGALCMSMGLPYDSDEARNLCGCISAILTARAYLTSAELANELGAFEEFNSTAMLAVLEKHADATGKLTGEAGNLASDLWEEVLACESFRNSQLSLCAPCGTISFLLDCDTTGIEPELALVKTKTLVGGGTLTLVNKSVEAGLKALVKGDLLVAGLLDYVTHNETLVGNIYLTEDEMKVFATSWGDNQIPWEAHLKMLAASQPFLSGGISKTVSLPSDATVETVANAYLLGWKLGLKSVAIYRDGSKGSQPLNIKKTTSETVNIRRRLPDTRESITHKFVIDGHKGYLTVGLYPNGQPGELFISVAKEGSTLGGIFDCFGLATSIGLQYGVPLSEFIDKFTHVRFEPMGFTKNPDIRIAKSIIDYIFRWLAIKFTMATPHDVNAPTVGTLNAPIGTLDAPICGECGALTTRVGACFLCYGCGTSGGCS